MESIVTNTEVIERVLRERILLEGKVTALEEAIKILDETLLELTNNQKVC